LKLHGRTIGAIALYACEPDYFDEESVTLLDEMAANVSFALESLDSAQQREEAVGELNQFFALSRDMLSISDLSGCVSLRNAACEKITAFAPGERWVDGVHPEDRAAAMAALARLQIGRRNGFVGAAVCVPRQRIPVAGGERHAGAGTRHGVRRDARYHRAQEPGGATTTSKSCPGGAEPPGADGESHEERVPGQYVARIAFALNGIIGFTEILYDGRIGALPGPQKELLGRMLKSSRHLLRLINDVPDVSRIESGRLELRPERVALANLVQEVTGILAGLAAEKKVGVEIRVSLLD
jgi:hypothetical protein